MVTAQLNTVVRYLRKVTASQLASSCTDAALLERFVSQRDEAAFEALVHRHGPMVLGLCQRVLRNAHDAEDAFQATFLVLVHKAGSVQKRTSLGHWLYGVAYRTALQARTDRARRRLHERKGATMAISEPDRELLCQELRSVVDEEVNRLPEKYRAPVVLCYLEGRTYEEASRQLRWPKGTVAIRLARARERLRTKLVKRGLASSGASMLAPVSPSLLASTVQAAALTAAGRTGLAGIVSASALALSKTMLDTMSMTTLKTALAVFLALGAATIGPGLFLRQGVVANQSPTAATQPAALLQKAEPPAGQAKEDSPKKSAYDAAPLARRWWAIMELVEKTHLEPCPRKDMILAGATALLGASKAAPPADLERRASEVASLQQLATFLAEIWPATQNGRDTKLEDASTEGLVKQIPGEARLFTADHARIASQVASNRYVGIGIQIAMHKEEKVAQIVNPFRGGAARKAGALPDDLILEVDGKSTRDIELMKVVEWLRGEEGTDVTIVVRQPAATQTRSLRMTRAVVPFETLLGCRRISEEMWTYRVDPTMPIGYVFVDSIRASTLHELRKLEAQLRAEGCRALVLDFRSSVGQGILQHAALVADGLLDGGLMWSVRDGHGAVQEFRADRECLFRNWPLAVLVDRDLADRAQGSVIAALQDSGRAVVVGESTKFDGYVNALLPLPDSTDSIMLRTARLVRAANGKSWPIEPNHVVPLSDSQRAAVLAWLRQKEKSDPPAGAEARPPDDPQLAKAVDILRDALETQAASGRR